MGQNSSAQLGQNWIAKPRGGDALHVNWFEIEIRNERGQTTYLNSFITNLAVRSDNVADLATCGRAQWKIESETFNVLKNNGYNLEHLFGHGKQNLAAILASALNLLAFAFHAACDTSDDLWRAARAKLGPRYNSFSKLAGMTAFLIFPSREDLLLTLAFPPLRAKPPPRPPRPSARSVAGGQNPRINGAAFLPDEIHRPICAVFARCGSFAAGEREARGPWRQPDFVWRWAQPPSALG